LTLGLSELQLLVVSSSCGERPSTESWLSHPDAETNDSLFTFTQYVVISPIPFATMVSSLFVSHLSLPDDINLSAVAADT
jgi:hypothetical protein